MFNRKIIFALLSFLFLFGISCTESGDDEYESETKETIDDEEFSPSEESVFNLESKWLNQNDEEVQLSVLASKPTVLAMIYTHCQYSCPLIVKDMKDIYEAVPNDIRSDVNFVLISIDPEHDRPDTLSKFMRKEKMDEKHWTMFVSTETNIRELAAVLGFKYKKSSLMDYAHSNLITVLNAKGEIVKQKDGLGTERSELVEELKKQVD